MRTDQIIGLNVRAEKYIQGKDKVVGERTIIDRYYNHFGELGNTITKSEHIYSSTVKVEEYSSYYGMFGDPYELMRYTHIDGKVYDECVQSSPWSDGPMFFLALSDKNGVLIQETLWTEEEMENCK